MKTKVIAVFDIGKTNKKMLLFDRHLKVVHQEERSFPEVEDDDSDPCDDLDGIEAWIKASVEALAKSTAFELIALNFTTYGASLAFLNKDKERLTPLYNYLKEVPENLAEQLYEAYGGQAEFTRRTASPALGKLLNSGVQLRWLMKHKREVFGRVKSIMHFPQYLSFLFSGKVISEATSVGCHTFMWDYDKGSYHPWLADAGIQLPEPLPASHRTKVILHDCEVMIGTGLHDSSSSLAPYLRAAADPFILLSTGTWCVSMNPFNQEALSPEQLEGDCLCYLSINRQAVKSNMLFMGHIHDMNTVALAAHYGEARDAYKKVEADPVIMIKMLETGRGSVFFREGVPASYVDESVDLRLFSSFGEAYHRLIFDLSLMLARSMDLITSGKEGLKRLYIAGGFARNEIFVRLLASLYPELEVLTSEVDNASALGAALVLWDCFGMEGQADPDLGLKPWVGV